MPINPYFANFKSNADSKLLHELTNEVINIHGIEVKYVPRTANNVDSIFEEDTTASFNTAYSVAMYVDSAEGFEGEGDYLSKFGVEIRDRITFTVARREFNGAVTRYDSAIKRPREGDLIYFPLNKKLFEIRFVEHESMFYPLGDLYVYQCQCELFEYSNEPINTGDPNIDIIEDLLSTDVYQYALDLGNNTFLVDENGALIMFKDYDPGTVQDPGEDNDKIQEAADEIIDFTVQDPFSERGTY